MTRECPFCDGVLELLSGGGLTVDTWRCELCHYRESYGLEQLPDPDRLRDRAEDLEAVADQLEASELGSYLSRWSA